MLAVFCVGIVGVVLYLFAQFQSANWWVSHSLLVLQESDQSLLCLMDCETAYRGYLIRGRDEYLAPYEKCYGEVNSHIEKIANLTADNPSQQALIPELRSLAAKKIGFSQDVIAARKASRDAGNWKPGVALINIDTGKELMDKFRVLIDRV